jgi:hypothetical protein
VHHGDDPNLVGPVEVDDRIRKWLTEMPAGRRLEGPAKPRLCAHLIHKPVNAVMKTPAELRTDGRLVFRRRFELGTGRRMETKRFHRPTMWRISAMTSSPGMPVTCPLSISATRLRSPSGFNFCIRLIAGGDQKAVAKLDELVARQLLRLGHQLIKGHGHGGSVGRERINFKAAPADSRLRPFGTSGKARLSNCMDKEI